MLVWFKQSLKKLHERQRQQAETQTEVSELQGAVIELAEIVSEIVDNNSGGDENG